MTPRIAIDLATLHPGRGGAGGGIWSYARHLVEELDRIEAGDVELVALAHADLPLDGLRRVRVARVAADTRSIAGRLRWVHVELPAWCRRNGVQVLHKLGLDRTDKVKVGGVEVSPRDVVAACLPDPATLGDKMRGKTCAGLWVTGTGKDGRPRSTYLYHVVDNEWSMQEYGHQCVVWQTAVNPVVALELLANGTWSGAGVLGPEAFDAQPFLDLLTAYGSPWGIQEL